MKHGQSSAALRMSLVIASVLLSGAQAAGPPPGICTADHYISQLANVSNFQTSATLLASVLATLGGAPRNSTVFVPTDAAWTKFRSVNGASAPDMNRTIAIFLYNSVLGVGVANLTELEISSPLQTSAGIVNSFFARANILVPLTVGNVSTDGLTATATTSTNATGRLGPLYTFCDTNTFAVDTVLLPGSSYANTSESFPAEIAALNARQQTAAPVGPAPAPNPMAAMSPAMVPAIAPITALSPMAAMSPSPAMAMAPTVATASAPPPASAASPAAACAIQLACGLLGAAVLLLA